MRKFDTTVQYVKYKVLKEVARQQWANTLETEFFNIPKILIDKNVPTRACCVYKERALIEERVKLAMGGDKTNPNIIEVISMACDECSTQGYQITSLCRGCLAHRCENVCKKGAITFDENHVAHIDKSKCVDCGMCAKACQFNAIVNYNRPCINACKVKAISMDSEQVAIIDNEKCIQCGACVYQCPFGAMQDKSMIVDVIKHLQNSDNNKKFHVYAIVAPSVASQFSYIRIGQFVKGLYELGFYKVVEAAMGADIVAYNETKELKERGFLTSSCCPAFVKYVQNNFPNLKDKISSNKSPMITVGELIRSIDKDAKIVFIGPCTAKKAEINRDDVKGIIDDVLTFEEILALIDSKEIQLENLEELPLENASYFGRIFARSGGLTDAVREVNLEAEIGVEVKPCVCSGIDEIKKALFSASKGTSDVNFIEGMACEGGCINGAGAMTHALKNVLVTDNYSKSAKEKSIMDVVKNTNKMK